MSKPERRQLAPAKPLSGFADTLPADKERFDRLTSRLKRTFESFGYRPIDTPCIYLVETLQGGGDEIDKQLFRWKQRDDKELALRFDLTVPLARYVAANEQHLNFPFRRYDIGKVWRGERAQRGRYREFTQCDFDIVGTTAASSDLEAILLVSSALIDLGLKPADFQLRVNDRRILDGLCELLSITDRTEFVLRCLDKRDKIGDDKLITLLREGDGQEPGIGEAADTLQAQLLPEDQSKDAITAKLGHAAGSQSDKVREGASALQELLELSESIRPELNLLPDLSLARGLGYYTGMVFETTLTALPELGSIASGGRYDNLASAYTKLDLPGVGGSIGLSRLLAGWDSLSIHDDSATERALVAPMPEVSASDAYQIADAVRHVFDHVTVYPLDGSKLKKQLKYADAEGFTWAVIIGSGELAEKAVSIKHLPTQKQETVPLDSLPSWYEKRFDTL